jgi:hypothetical protein
MCSAPIPAFPPNWLNVVKFPRGTWQSISPQDMFFCRLRKSHQTVLNVTVTHPLTDCIEGQSYQSHGVLMFCPVSAFCITTFRSPEFPNPTSPTKKSGKAIYLRSWLIGFRRLFPKLGWQQRYSGLWTFWSHQNWNVIKTEMLPKLKCHQNWNVTRTEMSPKLKCHQN